MATWTAVRIRVPFRIGPDEGMTTARCHVLLREAGAMGSVKTNAALTLVSVKAEASIAVVSLSP